MAIGTGTPTITETARAFFDACETGKGWEGCSAYCQPDASFSAQAEPLADVHTLKDYTEWMKGLLGFMPDGRYEVRTIVPPPYEVPKDGPVGRLLGGLGRHAFRPAHVHYRADAEGYAPLTTMVFFTGDPWLGDDVIGAEKAGLTIAIDRSRTPAEATFDLTLARPSR